MELQSRSDGRQSVTDDIERVVRSRTRGLIHGLRVVFESGGVVISGKAPSYYAKQLATHAAMEVAENVALTNDIEVG